MRFVLVGAIACLWACTGTGDRLEVPTPAREDFVAMQLSCLYATSIDDLVLGGWLDRADGGVDGVVLRTRDGGRTWRRVGSETREFRNVIVQGLHFNDRLRGWYAGVRVEKDGVAAVVGRTSDAGGHWTHRVIPEPRALFVSHLEDLVFSGDDVGRVEVVYEDAETGRLVGNVYGTQDGGRNWVISSFADVVGAAAQDPMLQFVSETQGFRLGAPDADGVQHLHFTASGGRAWREISRFHVSQLETFYGPLDDRAELQD